MAVTTRPERTDVMVHDPLQTPLGQMIEPYRATLAPFLWEGITLEKVAAQLHLASRKTPALAECEAGVLVDAVCKALSFGGNIGSDVHIVPFKNRGVMEPTIMLDYKFKVELVVHAGGARSIDAVPVWDDEIPHFSIEMGSEPRIVHRPSTSPPANRKLAGAYAVAHFGRNHTPKVLWMTAAEIEVVRATSRQWGPRSNPPVLVCPPWYAVKTVVHRIVKLLPKNPKLARLFGVMELEERGEFGDPADDRSRQAHVDADGVDLTYTPAAAPVAGADAAFPTLEDESEGPTRTLAWAHGYPLPEMAGDLKGRPVGSMKSSTYLNAVLTWAERNDQADLALAISMVLESRGAAKAEA
jgi:recombinational DNA repair protein RecT